MTEAQAAIFPRAAALQLNVVAGTEGFDIEDVEKALGDGRFKALWTFLADKSVFVCGHRTQPLKVGEKTLQVEVHCVYGRDLEAFLEQGS